MKQQLWMVNSSLLAIFILTTAASILLQQAPPRYRPIKIFFDERKVGKELQPEEIENIYKYDLFGTFVKKEFVPSAQQLVTPIPQPKPIVIAPPPKLPEVKILPPLTLTLRGIAFSSNEEKSIAIIEDEKKKESVYHSGDMIKDAQIIKVAQNRITLLRTNGQHETFFLRPEDNAPETIKKEEAAKAWDHIVKKIDETTFEIDKIKFAQSVSTLGELVAALSLLTASAKGEPIGIKITSIDPNHISSFLGLQKNDIIVSINEKKTGDKKERIKIYDDVSTAKTGDTIVLKLQRNKNDITLKYNLKHIQKVRKRIFAPTTQASEKKEKPALKTPDALFSLNKLQKREKRRREFIQAHPENQETQQQAINKIRQRLLENIRAKIRNTRIR